MKIDVDYKFTNSLRYRRAARCKLQMRIAKSHEKIAPGIIHSTILDLHGVLCAFRQARITQFAVSISCIKIHTCSRHKKEKTFT